MSGQTGSDPMSLPPMAGLQAGLREPSPVWPGLLGGFVLLALTHGMLAGLGPSPLDPLFRLDLRIGLQPVLLDPLVRVLAGLDASVVQVLATLTGAAALAGFGYGLRRTLGLRTLSLVLFLLGAWAWTRPDPYALASFGHWLRLGLLGLGALALLTERVPPPALAAGLGCARAALCGDSGLLIDALFLWILMTAVEEGRLRRLDKPRLLSLGAWILAAYAFARLGPGSGRIAIPDGIEGFEDTMLDFPPLQLGGTPVLLLGAAVFAYAAPQGLASRGRAYVAMASLGLCLVLMGGELGGHRYQCEQQGALMRQDLQRCDEVLAKVPAEGRLLLVCPPLHLRPYLCERLGPARFDDISVLDTWDLGNQIALPVGGRPPPERPCLRWTVPGPALQDWAALEDLESLPRAALLALHGTRFPLAPSEQWKLGSLPVPLEAPAALEVLRDRYRDEGREVDREEDLEEAAPGPVRLSTVALDEGLRVIVEPDGPCRFLVALAVGAVEVEALDTGPALLHPQSYEGRPDFFTYYMFLSEVYEDLEERDLYSVEVGDGLTVRPLSWLPGFGPVYHVVAAAAGRTQFVVRRKD